MEKLIKALKDSKNVRDENKKPINFAGTINVAIKLGYQAEMLPFYVTDKLAMDVILDCDLYDRHVEEILPKKPFVELDDGTTLITIRKMYRR